MSITGVPSTTSTPANTTVAPDTSTIRTRLRPSGLIRRGALVANTAVPPVEVDPGDGTVRLHERILRAEPVREVPLNRRYLLG